MCSHPSPSLCPKAGPAWGLETTPPQILPWGHNIKQFRDGQCASTTPIEEGYTQLARGLGSTGEYTHSGVSTGPPVP